MKHLLIFLAACAFSATASAGNLFNIEGSGCIPDKHSIGVFKQTVNGVTVASGTPGGTYTLYCPINYFSGQTITSFHGNAFEASNVNLGATVIWAHLYRMVNATGVRTLLATISSGFVPFTPTSFGGSISYTPNPATESYWVEVDFIFATPSIATLINIQLD